MFVKLATATLYTDNLDYYRNLSEARYFNGGRLVDSTNNLTSRKGYYNTRTNLASFKTKVVGVNPDYTLKSDTLRLQSKTKIVVLPRSHYSCRQRRTRPATPIRREVFMTLKRPKKSEISRAMTIQT